MMKEHDDSKLQTPLRNLIDRMPGKYQLLVTPSQQYNLLEFL